MLIHLILWPSERFEFQCLGLYTWCRSQSFQIISFLYLEWSIPNQIFQIFDDFRLQFYLFTSSQFSKQWWIAIANQKRDLSIYKSRKVIVCKLFFIKLSLLGIFGNDRSSLFWSSKLELYFQFSLWKVNVQLQNEGKIKAPRTLGKTKVVNLKFLENIF